MRRTLLLVTLLLAFVATGKQTDAQETAPAFPDSLEWLNTSYPLNQDDFSGKFVLLSFWTPGSSTCQLQLDTLEHLAAAYNNIEVVLVSSAKYPPQRSKEYLHLFIIENEIPFPVVNDTQFQLWEAFSVSAWPTNILVDPGQKIVWRSEGASLEQGLDEALKGYKGKTKKSGVTRGTEINSFEQGLLVFPSFVETDSEFALFISESRGHRIVQTDFNDTFEQAIGTGKPGYKDGDINTAEFNHPTGLAFHPVDSLLFISDTGNDVIRRCDLKTGEVITVLGNGQRPSEIPEMVVEKLNGINHPTGLELIGDQLYIAMTGWNQIWKYDINSGIATPIAGSGEVGLEDGKGMEAKLAEPYDLTHDPDGVVYFTERQSNAVRMLKKGKVTTLLGTGLFEFGDVDGKSKDALLQAPAGIAYHDETLYVADQLNHKIKAIDPYNGRTETFMGAGEAGFFDGAVSQTRFNSPSGVCVLRDHLFVADKYNHALRKISLRDEYIETYAFKNLDQMPMQGLNKFQVVETDTIFLPDGEAVVNFTFVPDSLWQFYPLAPQSAVVTTRNPNIFEDPNGVSPRSGSIRFELNNDGELKYFVTETELFLQNIENPGRLQYRTFAIMVLLGTDPTAAPVQQVQFPIPRL